LQKSGMTETINAATSKIAEKEIFVQEAAPFILTEGQQATSSQQSDKEDEFQIEKSSNVINHKAAIESPSSAVIGKPGLIESGAQKAQDSLVKRKKRSVWNCSCSPS